MSTKPHKGTIKNWYKGLKTADGRYRILGEFVDHPEFAGESGYTSLVESHDEATGEIETRYSRYTLVEPRDVPVAS